MLFGTRVRAITQGKLARRVGSCPSLIAKIERNATPPGPDLELRIRAGLGLSAQHDDAFHRTDCLAQELPA